MTRNKWKICWLIAAIGLALLAGSEVGRVQRGKLFLFALPTDAPASHYEMVDARSSAETYRLPAIGSVFVVVLLLGAGVRRSVSQGLVFRWPWITIFVVAAIADVASTLMFFHAHGIDLELHPSIRLFGYAYGRTVGPIAGKTIQAAGIVLVSALWPRFAPLLLGAATLFCGAAAIYNVATL